MNVDAGVAMPDTVFTLVMKFLSQTPKNFESSLRGRYGDVCARLHARDYLNASTVASSPYRPSILGVATHLALRGLRRDVQHIDRCLQHVDILDSDERPVTRVRELVYAYQVLAEAFACFLNLHPRMRREAGRLRAEAEDTFTPDESSDSGLET